MKKYREKKKIKSTYELFESILSPYADGFFANKIPKITIGEITQKRTEAKKTLRNFYCEYKKLSPDTEYHGDDRFTWYIFYFLRLRDMLEEEDYPHACNEIINILYFQPFLQPRVYYNMLELLEQYVIEGSKREMPKSIFWKGKFFDRIKKVKESKYLREGLHGDIGYYTAIDRTKLFVNNADKEEEKLTIIDFVMRLVKNDLKYDALSKIIYNGMHKGYLPPYIIPTYYVNNVGEKVNVLENNRKKECVDISLSSESVIVMPWKDNSFVSSILRFKTESFVMDKNNHYAYYYPEIDVCHIAGGLHSAGACTVYKKGTIKAQVVHINKLFDNVSTNGSYWLHPKTKEVYRHLTGEKLKVSDFRIAVLYELARMKSNLINNSSD